MKHRHVSALATLALAAALSASASAGAAPGPPSSSREDTEAAVLRLLDDWAAAYVKHDRAAIDRILGEEFVMSSGRPELQTRDEYLRKVESDTAPHASITRVGERVRVYGDLVVVNHRLTRTTAGYANPAADTPSRLAYKS